MNRIQRTIMRAARAATPENLALGARVDDGFRARMPAPVLSPPVPIEGTLDALGAPSRDAGTRPADGPPDGPIASEAPSGAAVRPDPMPRFGCLPGVIIGADGRIVTDKPTGWRPADGDPFTRSRAAHQTARAKADLPPEEAAALGNLLTAARAAEGTPGEPAAPTLTDTLSGLRAAEETILATLASFESKFRGCEASDIRIYRATRASGESRIASVLIDLKLGRRS